MIKIYFNLNKTKKIVFCKSGIAMVRIKYIFYQIVLYNENMF